MHERNRFKIRRWNCHQSLQVVSSRSVVTTPLHWSLMKFTTETVIGVLHGFKRCCASLIRSQVWSEELSCFPPSSCWLLSWPTPSQPARTAPSVSHAHTTTVLQVLRMQFHEDPFRCCRKFFWKAGNDMSSMTVEFVRTPWRGSQSANPRKWHQGQSSRQADFQSRLLIQANI